MHKEVGSMSFGYLLLRCGAINGECGRCLVSSTVLKNNVGLDNFRCPFQLSRYMGQYFFGIFFDHESF